jgi:hypothetical protein
MVSPEVFMSDIAFKETGAPTEFKSGAQRDARGGKGAFYLIPQTALFLVARVYEDGGARRGNRNWEKGMTVSTYIDSAMRHCAKYLAGFRDEPHLAQACWNLLCALQTNVWVWLGLRDASLYDMPSHVDSKPPMPLSATEIEWLKVWGLEKKTLADEVEDEI